MFKLLINKKNTNKIKKKILSLGQIPRNKFKTRFFLQYVIF